MSSLTIHLGKRGLTSRMDLMRHLDQVDHFKLSYGGEDIGDLFVIQRTPRIPSWASFFDGSSVERSQLGRTRSAGAVLLTTVAGRHFALTFGHSYHLIDKDKAEDRFGLLVVLNSIDPSRLRSIDKNTFDAISKKSREQAVRDAETQEFGLDVEQDLLRAVTGAPKRSVLGKQLSGKDTLRAVGDFSLSNLKKTLHRYLSQFEADSYKEAFPWVDNIQEIQDKGVVESLDGTLESLITSGNWDNIWIAAPDIIDWQRISGFTYGYGKTSPIVYDIHLGTLLEHLQPRAHNVDGLKRKKVYAIDTNDQVVEQWSVYRCLHAEIELDGRVYLLSNGRWYEAAGAFVERISKLVDQVPQLDRNLPVFDDKFEKDYNRRVAQELSSTYALLDRDLIPYGGGQSKVEACDLYSIHGEFVHVKRYGGSSDLSHLFAQGVVSGELFARDVEFRDAFNEKLPEDFRFTKAFRILPRGEFKVVYAIVSKSDQPLQLPFFSRLNLKNAYERLSSLGYEVFLCKVGVAPTLRLLKEYKKVEKKTRGR